MAKTQQAGVVKSMTGATFAPARIFGKPDNVMEMRLGVIIGRANGLATATGRDDELLEGLKGMFAFQDAEDRGVFKSYQFWPMSGMMQDLFELPRKGEQVDFAFEVYAIRAGNEAGRSWKVVPLMEADGVDPLAEVAAKAGLGNTALVGGKAAAPAIEGPKEAPADQPATEKEPAHAPKGGKGK